MNDPARHADTDSIPHRQRLIERYTVRYVRAFEHGAIMAGGGAVILLGSFLLNAWGFSGFQVGWSMLVGIVLWMTVLLKMRFGLPADERIEHERIFGLMAERVAEMMSREDAENLHAELLSGNNLLSDVERKFAWEVLIQKRVIPRGPSF